MPNLAIWLGLILLVLIEFLGPILDRQKPLRKLQGLSLMVIPETLDIGVLNGFNGTIFCYG